MVRQYHDERTTSFSASIMLNCKHTAGVHQSGFALIEALISLLIISFGLLGLAGLQVRLTTLEVESYQRTQALILAKDIASRLTNNAKAAATYNVSVSASGSATTFVGTDGITLDNCIPAPAATSETSASQSARLATCDLKKWENALLGLTEGGTSALAEPRGCIEPTGTASEYRVSVTWRGMAATVEPAVACASSKYADQKLRRAINLVVRVPDLDCNSTKATGC